MGYPRYVGHKEVGAAKISGVDRGSDGGLIVHLAGFSTVRFTQREKSNKPIPETGWYMLVYDDGYISFSPPDQFEKGYTAKEEPGLDASRETNAAYLAEQARAAGVVDAAGSIEGSPDFAPGAADKDDSADEAAALAGADNPPPAT